MNGSETVNLGGLKLGFFIMHLYPGRRSESPALLLSNSSLDTSVSMGVDVDLPLPGLLKSVFLDNSLGLGSDSGFAVL